MNEVIRSASRIYLDSNALIYFVERSDALQKKVGAVIAWAIDAKAAIVVSEIGIAECLHGAYKLQNAALEETYNEIFYTIALFDIAPVDGALVKAAAKIAAEKALKLVDAIHFLTAVETRCEVFLTTDRRFHSSHTVEVVQIDEL